MKRKKKILTSHIKKKVVSCYCNAALLRCFHRRRLRAGYHGVCLLQAEEVCQRSSRHSRSVS